MDFFDTLALVFQCIMCLFLLGAAFWMLLSVRVLAGGGTFALVLGYGSAIGALVVLGVTVYTLITTGQTWKMGLTAATCLWLVLVFFGLAVQYVHQQHQKDLHAFDH